MLPAKTGRTASCVARGGDARVGECSSGGGEPRGNGTNSSSAAKADVLLQGGGNGAPPLRSMRAISGAIACGDGCRCGSAARCGERSVRRGRAPPPTSALGASAGRFSRRSRDEARSGDGAAGSTARSRRGLLRGRSALAGRRAEASSLAGARSSTRTTRNGERGPDRRSGPPARPPASNAACSAATCEQKSVVSRRETKSQGRHARACSAVRRCLNLLPAKKMSACDTAASGSATATRPRRTRKST